MFCLERIKTLHCDSSKNKLKLNWQQHMITSHVIFLSLLDESSMADNLLLSMVLDLFSHGV